MSAQDSPNSAENDAGYMAVAWLRGDGTGYFLECPVCHFYKVYDPGKPCRRIGCDGITVKVEFRVTSPGETGHPWYCAVASGDECTCPTAPVRTGE